MTVFKLTALILFAATLGHADGAQAEARRAPLRILIAGVTHGHVDWILYRDRNKWDVEIVGLQDRNVSHMRDLARRHGISESVTFENLDQAIERLNPDGIFAFGAIDEHLSVVRSASARRIPVMVEKPLAHTLEDAYEIQAITNRTGTRVMVNYETNWYPALENALQRIGRGEVGRIRKLEFRDGHQGPVELGAKREFLDWLTDSGRGGGALIDFGCYGANIATQIFRGLPKSVFATTATNKPQIYPRAEDEATIVLQYESAQVVIESSWNWPFGIKDATFSGDRGLLFQRDRNRLVKKHNSENEENLWVDKLEEHGNYEDAFAFFSHVVRNDIALKPYSSMSLENNIIVMRILDAARRSARDGRRIDL